MQLNHIQELQDRIENRCNLVKYTAELLIENNSVRISEGKRSIESIP